MAPWMSKGHEKHVKKGVTVAMKRNLASIAACGALVATLGLLGCNNASKPETSAVPTEENTVSTTETLTQSPETTEAPATVDEPEEEPESSPFAGIYEKKAHELESTRDSYVQALNNDYGDWPEGGEEALNLLLDDDYELMTRTLNETYDSGVEWLEETDGPDDERQSYIDDLATVRDECLSVVTQTIEGLRP